MYYYFDVFVFLRTNKIGDWTMSDVSFDIFKHVNGLTLTTACDHRENALHVLV